MEQLDVMLAETYTAEKIALGWKEAASERAQQISYSWPIHSPVLEMIASVLSGRFDAEFSMICLVDMRSGDLAMQVVQDSIKLLSDLGEVGVRRIARRALEGNKLHPFQVSTLSFEWLKPVEDLHLLVLPVALGLGDLRGAVMLARSGSAFSHADRAFFGHANTMAYAVA